MKTIEDIIQERIKSFPFVVINSCTQQVVEYFMTYGGACSSLYGYLDLTVIDNPLYKTSLKNS